MFSIKPEVMQTLFGLFKSKQIEMAEANWLLTATALTRSVCYDSYSQSRAHSQAHDKPPDLSIANESRYATLMSDKYIQGDGVQDSKTACFFLSVSQEQKAVLK